MSKLSGGDSWSEGGWGEVNSMIRYSEVEARRRRVRCGQRGEVLVESLISVAIIGLLFVGFMGGVMTSVATARVNNQQVRTSNEASSLAELIDRAAYVPCATTASYASVFPATAATGGYVASVERVRYLVSSTATTATYQNVCTSPDKGAQEITVRIATADGTKRQLLTFTKRDDRCPASIATIPGQRC